MRFSIAPMPTVSWAEILGLVSHCEATGWDGVYFTDHFMPNAPDATARDGDTFECWSALAAIAAAVPRLRLGSLVTSVTYRHPAVLANMAAAIDHISGGRLVLGVGAGWQENEHVAYGLELGTLKERLDRLDEACAAITSLLSGERTTFEGEHFRLTDAPNQPRPVQERLPLLVGGGGERRTMRIAARWADEWNAWMTPESLVHKREVLAGHADAVGRDAGEILISTQALLFLSTDESWLAGCRELDLDRPTIVGTPAEVTETIARYDEAGLDEMIVPAHTLGDLERAKDTCDLFLEEVAVAFRS